jgi:hypothetical protein
MAVYELALGRIDVRWYGLALLTVLSASATIKVPSVPARISVSETFVFTSLLVFGVWAGVLTVALDGLVASMWIHRRGRNELYRALFNVTVPGLALWIAASVCFKLQGVSPIVERVVPMQQLLSALFLLAALYFLLNSWLMAFAISAERQVSARSVWSSNFLWLAINYFGGASVSVLLVLLFSSTVVNSVALGIIVPLLTFFYLTFRIALGRSDDSKGGEITTNPAVDGPRTEPAAPTVVGGRDEFDQLLVSIVGSADTLLRDAPLSEPHQRELQQILETAGRARTLILKA